MLDKIAFGEHVIEYHIDIRDSQTGFWKTIKTFKPTYQIKTRVKKKQWLLFWIKEVEEEILNESEARTQSRIDAIKEAVLLRAGGHDVRLYLVYSKYVWGSPCANASRIWQNGRWLDD